MKLTFRIKALMDHMWSCFARNCSFRRFQRQIFATLLACSRHTMTQLIVAMGREQRDWSQEYRLQTEVIWDPEGCFDVILKQASQLIPDELPFIPIAIDDFGIRKTGRKIAYTGWQRDPSGPPFGEVSLRWGLRYLHAALLIPQSNQSARGVPIRLWQAPALQKPGKKAPEEQWEEYWQIKPLTKLSIVAAAMVRGLRDTLDEQGCKERNLLIVGDGGFCNRVMFEQLPNRTNLLVRCRKDARLCHCSDSRGRFYSTKKFTPRDVHKPINWRTGSFNWGGGNRAIQYACDPEVYWQHGSQKRPLRLITLCGLVRRGTAKRGAKRYREPMYLLTTDLSTPVELLIQTYLHRWEIEVNHRDLKTNLGLGEAQVRHERSVWRQSQTVTLCYSLTLLAGLLEFGPQRGISYIPPPKWYRGRSRPTIEDYKRLARRELCDDQSLALELGMQIGYRRLALGCAA